MTPSDGSGPQPSTAVKVVVATTVMLSFISFWRAAAVVLSDLASSAYYAGGIAETAIGKSAPWFILSIMLFSYAVRAIYIESCSMFVRGGVYKVVHEAMGGTLAKFSVSALMFDYVLTGPISAVSAGLYLAGLLNETEDHFQFTVGHVNPPLFAAGFAVLVTLYFWRKNIIGLRESSENALRIMQITTVMVVVLVAWCLITVFVKGFQPVPLPTRENLNFGPDALGWLKGTAAPKITFIAILVGLGHSLLAMSGEESLAQVNREIEAPKLKNLERAGFVIFLYSLLFTSLVSFFAVMLIPDAQRARYLGNLIGGLSMFLAGQADRNIHEEDHAPMQISYDQSAGYRPEHGGDQAGNRHETHSADQFGFRKGAHQSEVSHGHHHGSAATLQNTAGDQKMDVLGDAAEERSQRKDADGGGEHPPCAEPVRHPAADGYEDCEAEGVAGENRFHAQRRHLQGGRDGGRRGVQNRRIQRFHKKCHGDKPGQELFSGSSQ